MEHNLGHHAHLPILSSELLFLGTGRSGGLGMTFGGQSGARLRSAKFHALHIVSEFHRLIDF